MKPWTAFGGRIVSDLRLELDENGRSRISFELEDEKGERHTVYAFPENLSEEE